MNYEKEIWDAARILMKKKNAVAFCGAGVSEESGISTFRDPGGIWGRVDPIAVGTPEGFLAQMGRDPAPLISIFTDLLDAFERAESNPGHRALAELEKRGILSTVITQNIDNLQEEAGSPNIIDLHGNLFRMVCLSCGNKKKYERRPFVRSLKKKLASLPDYSLPGLLSLVPRCDRCDSLTRPDVVMFGEAVQNLPRAFAAAGDCNVMLALGTSGIVYPAAELPFEAKRDGAAIIVINPNENAFESISDIYIPLKTGVALPAILSYLER